MRVRQWSFVLLCIIAASRPAFGQTAPHLSLADAVQEALQSHPDILAAERRVDAARQRPEQARSLADPMVSAGYTAVGTPLPGAGLGTEPLANIGVMVSQSLPFPGKRAARAAVASRDADAEFQQMAAARLDVTSRVAQAYYAVSYAQAVAGILERHADLLKTLATVSRERYAVGRTAQQDVIKADTQISLLELRQARVAQLLRTKQGELNALLGRRAGTPVGRTDELALAPFTESLAQLLARAEVNAPGLRRDQLLIERSQLAVDVARLDYTPDLTLSGGYAYMGSMPPMYEMRVDITLPLQRRRRAAAVAEQQSLEAAARQDYESTRRSLQDRIQSDFELAETSARLAALYRDTVLPQATLALESSMASYQTGAVDFLSVLTNVSMVLEYETAYVEELAQLHQACSRLEAATGAPLAH